MAHEKHVTIICDRCGDVKLTGETSVSDAYLEALDAGWRIPEDPHAADVCPACQNQRGA